MGSLDYPWAGAVEETYTELMLFFLNCNNTCCNLQGCIKAGTFLAARWQNCIKFLRNHETDYLAEKSRAEMGFNRIQKYCCCNLSLV